MAVRLRVDKQNFLSIMMRKAQPVNAEAVLWLLAGLTFC
jgi:hypothetical protein